MSHAPDGPRMKHLRWVLRTASHGNEQQPQPRATP
jgi:hypothetical protein